MSRSSRCNPGMTLQPDRMPISEEQLATEIKGIYDGVVAVETKCIDIDAASGRDTETHLNVEQWQAFIALHHALLREHHKLLMDGRYLISSQSLMLREPTSKCSVPARILDLLYEHHDFLMATQHPSASGNSKSLPTKYSMPAGMWKHGIHRFLEVLRHRRPDSLDYMLAFVVLAYRMMAGSQDYMLALAVFTSQVVVGSHLQAFLEMLRHPRSDSLDYMLASVVLAYQMMAGSHDDMLASIYDGGVALELQCIDIATALARDIKSQLGVERWQALIALPRTLLYEHHDFLMARQRPAPSDGLESLVFEYSMSTRMWKHSIHAFLELLRDLHRHPYFLHYSIRKDPAWNATFCTCATSFPDELVRAKMPGVREAGNCTAFERLRFKQATAKNGKRRASQQYFHLIAELLVDAQKDLAEDPKLITVAQRTSEEIVIRDRSPSRYQNEHANRYGNSAASVRTARNDAPFREKIDPNFRSDERIGREFGLSCDDIAESNFHTLTTGLSERGAEIVRPERTRWDDEQPPSLLKPLRHMISDSSGSILDSSDTAEQPEPWYPIGLLRGSFLTRLCGSLRKVQPAIVLLWMPTAFAYPVTNNGAGAEGNRTIFWEGVCILVPIALSCLRTYILMRKPLNQLKISNFCTNFEFGSAGVFLMVQTVSETLSRANLFILACWIGFWLVGTTARYRLTTEEFQARYLAVVVFGGALTSFAVTAAFAMLSDGLAGRQVVVRGLNLMPLMLSAFALLLYKAWKPTRRGEMPAGDIRLLAQSRHVELDSLSSETSRVYMRSLYYRGSVDSDDPWREEQPAARRSGS